MYRRAVGKVYSLQQRRPAGPTMSGIFCNMSAKFFTGNGWAGHSLPTFTCMLTGWAAKSVARQLATAVLWVRIQTSLKNQKS